MTTFISFGYWWSFLPGVGLEAAASWTVLSTVCSLAVVELRFTLIQLFVPQP